MSIHFLGAQDFCTPGPGGLSCIFMQDEEGKTEKTTRRKDMNTVGIIGAMEIEVETLKKHMKI